MKRKLLAATLAVMMVASLAGCGGSKEEAPAADAAASTATEEAAPAGETKALGDLKLAFIVGTENDAFYQTVEEGIKAECEAQGMQAPTLADQQLDGSICTDLINNYVAAEYDAVALSANDPAGTVPAIQQANEAGVAIFTFDCTLDDQYADQYVSFVGSNNYAGGVTAGEYVAENAPEGSVVGCITYASAQSTQDRQAGFEETIQAAIDGGKDLTLITSQDADNDQSKAADIMQNLITQYGDDLSYIFVVGDPTGYGALSSIQAAGASTKLVGFDAGQTACEYMLDEEVGKIWVAEVAQDPKGIGAGIVKKIAEYFTNGSVAGEQKDLIDCQLVTAENAADYL
ncbi:MAG: substrate-binding domain-containing protein [Dorea sp.]|nr:substrate-binding domain-containing protein [Dorea sp.]